MARKRPRPRKEPSRRRQQPHSSAFFPPGFFDRRALEKPIWDLVEKATGESIPETPLKQAQRLAYEAFRQSDPADRVRMARQALEISPDCADAHVLLAEHAGNPRVAIEHYEQGVAAGERALGPAMFEEEVGHFWRLIETRPYMRAREGLAHALWSAARNEQAIGHLREMLRLNPGDNQGVRFALTAWLLTLGRDDEVESMLDQYDDAGWNLGFTKALIEFRRKGDTAEGRQLLRLGHDRNRSISPWLLEDEPFPPERPDSYQPGNAAEGYFYVEASRCAWRSTPGAIAWMRRTFAQASSVPDPSEATFRPPGGDRARLERLPACFETWQAGFRRIPTWMKQDGERIVPWVVLVNSESTGLVLESTALNREPGATDLWKSIVKAMTRTATGGPHRPSTIEVQPDPRWDRLRPFLDEVGVELQERESLELMDEMLGDLTEHLLQNDPPGILDMPRVTPRIVGRLFHAAADFYRQAPWRSVGDGYAVRIECPRFDSGPWAAVIMGQAGLTLGLALYDRLDVLRELWASEPDREREIARESTSLVVTFDRECEVYPRDVAAAEQNGWEVVDPEVFPSVFRKEPGMSLRPPLSWELVLLEGCLRAVPAFLARHPTNDTARIEMTVPVATGELDLILSWVQ